MRYEPQVEVKSESGVWEVWTLFEIPAREREVQPMIDYHVAQPVDPYGYLHYLAMQNID